MVIKSSGFGRVLFPVFGKSLEYFFMKIAVEVAVQENKAQLKEHGLWQYKIYNV